MKYVQRDANGQIQGVYANPQPQPDGRCLTDPEPLSDDHKEVVEFLNRAMPRAISDGELAAILVKQNIITKSVVDAAMAGNDQMVATK